MNTLKLVDADEVPGGLRIALEVGDYFPTRHADQPMYISLSVDWKSVEKLAKDLEIELAERSRFLEEANKVGPL